MAMTDQPDSNLPRSRKKLLGNAGEAKKYEFKPRPVTPQYLDNAAAYYLQRFSASAEKLRQILTQKVKRRVGREGEVPNETAQWISELIEKYIARGWLDDAAYAQSQVRQLRGRGSSARQIAMKLQQKGLPSPQIKTALDDFTAAQATAALPDEEVPDPELTAALRYIQRRRLGPYRTREVENARDKDLAALMRQGFSLDIARQALAVERAD